ncbi:hypothetical protein P8A22_30100 [Streptomyces laculatispora]|uniref:Uncharacterized protein n=1 Tax=Streptomyces laculatispora TaxID=887464 RepID=A0ABY9IA85_9ACTN|nr:hypothetical protein [Streptomyces laculatispora]WLQ43802.1 hypothetical protein P8A22_30100 [Streptomyces laculatispora]
MGSPVEVDDPGRDGDGVLAARPAARGAAWAERPSGERHQQADGGVEHGEHVGPAGFQTRYRLLLLVRIVCPRPEPVRDGGAPKADRPDVPYAAG